MCVSHGRGDEPEGKMKLKINTGREAVTIGQNHGSMMLCRVMGVLCVLTSLAVHAEISKDLKHVLKGKHHDRFVNVTVNRLDTLVTRDDVDTFLMFTSACKSIEYSLAIQNSDKLKLLTEEIEQRNPISKKHFKLEFLYGHLREKTLERYQDKRLDELSYKALLMMVKSMIRKSNALEKKYPKVGDRYRQSKFMSEHCWEQLHPSLKILGGGIKKMFLRPPIKQKIDGSATIETGGSQ